MKNPWSKYASNQRLIKKGYFRKHSDGGSGRKAYQASRSNCVQQSRKNQEEKVMTPHERYMFYKKCACPICDKEAQKILSETYHNPTYIESSGISGILEYVKEVVLTEEVVYIGDNNEKIREENVGEAHQQGRQGIQGSDQGRYETEETNTIETKGKEMKKQSAKEKKHEAKETKAYEKKEDKKENKSKKSRFLLRRLSLHLAFLCDDVFSYNHYSTPTRTTVIT